MPTLFAILTFILAINSLFVTASPSNLDKSTRHLATDINPVRSCESLVLIKLPGVTIQEASIVDKTDASPAWCKVTAVVSRPDINNKITIWVGLPIENWNGRFQGTKKKWTGT